MKKLFLAALLAACVVLPLAAQEATDTDALAIDISKYGNVGMLSVPAYSKQFINEQTDILDSTYAFEATDEDFERIASLGGDEYDIDTAEEIALLSATAGVINIRPVEAAGMLPAGDPALVDLQLGAMLYMKKAAVSFLGGGDPAKYAAEIKFITDRGRVTEANIKDFVKQGIAATVDAEFNKVIFLLKNTSTSHNAILTRDTKNGQYILSYEGYYTNNIRKTLSAPTLEVLLAEMRKNKADFDEAGIQTVRDNVALIPAVFLGKIGKDPRADLTAILTAFYLNPTNQTVYGAMRDVNVFYDVAAGVSDNPTNREMYETIGAAYINTLTALSPELKQRVINDSRGRTSTALPSEVRNRLQLTSPQQ